MREGSRSVGSGRSWVSETGAVRSSENTPLLRASDKGFEQCFDRGSGLPLRAPRNSPFGAYIGLPALVSFEHGKGERRRSARPDRPGHE